MGGPCGGQAEKACRLSGASLGSKNLFNKFTALLLSFRCAFSDMRRLLEPCWWILFLKITSSVLHYVVCFPGECGPPTGRVSSPRAGYAELSPGAELGRQSRDRGEGEGGSGYRGGKTDLLHWLRQCSRRLVVGEGRSSGGLCRRIGGLCDLL